MGDFVSHDSGQFSFTLGSFDKAAIHVHISARQGEGVHVGNVDDFELIGILGSLHDFGQPLSYTRHVVSYRGVL